MHRAFRRRVRSSGVVGKYHAAGAQSVASTANTSRAQSPEAVPPGDDRQAPRRPAHPRGVHWEAWVLRGLLAALAAYQFATGNRNGANVAGMGLALSLIPVVVTRSSGWHVPRLMDTLFAFAIAVQFASESFKLFEIFTYWDKLVHPLEIFMASGVAALLMLGYRDVQRLRMADELAAAGAMLFGTALGAFWELIEFAFDWFGNANLQKSNADTMTDTITNMGGAVFGAILAVWLYAHRTNANQRTELGEIADWLTNRLSRILKHHGRLVGAVVALVFAAILLAGWWVDRGPFPPPAAGQGAPGEWQFSAVSASAPAAPVPILGDWVPKSQGICRVNTESPQPGSEKMGILSLNPTASYGAEPFALDVTYVAERPPFGAGTAMDNGLVFGLRDPENFYLLHVDTLHDVVSLERYVHGRKREQRDERRRTRGNERHELRAEVRGSSVTALLDGARVFEQDGLEETRGSIGLWSRVTAEGCFEQAAVTALA